MPPDDIKPPLAARVEENFDTCPAGGPEQPCPKPGGWLAGVWDFVQGVIPVYGSGMAAYNDFKTGHPVWGTVNVMMAATDLIPGKALLAGAGKLAVKGLLKGAVREGEEKLVKEVVEQGVKQEAKQLEGQAAKEVEQAAARPSSKPEWLQRLDEGNEFNKNQAGRYPHNEVYIDRPDGKGYYRVDSYNPTTGEIVSRKNTQFSEIRPETGADYVNELAKKYPPGSSISKVPSSGELAGGKLQGQMILEVPSQAKPIPQSVLDAAEQKGILIRDITGKVY